MDKVQNLIRTTKYSEFPELEDADNKLEKGLCPACGAETNDKQNCPECELPLWFDEEAD